MFAQSKGGSYSLTNDASGVADAIDFDGATDYVSRPSDLIGNADGKTFTFSGFGYKTSGGGVYFYHLPNSARIGIEPTGMLVVQMYDSTVGAVINMTLANAVADNTFFSLLISCDVSNSSKRHVYINDVAVFPTWSSYNNANINWTSTGHTVGKYSTSVSLGRLSHAFLDYTYRDLSVEANRRLFITADRKPAANQAALNPVLYLPLNDPTQPGKNLGTGGDFTLNGAVARSGRGPSQFNAPYSDLNGASQYLSRTSITGIADSKLVTCAFAISPSSVASRAQLSFDGNKFSIGINASGQFVIKGANAAGASILSATVTSPIAVIDRNYVVALSVDMANASNRAVTVNGVAATVTWTTYTDDAIDFTNAAYNIGRLATATEYTQGKLGNVFFDTKYIDLSQPASLAKFFTGTGIDAKPADLGANGELPFGTPPLIYLPMYGNNAGKNYGTGGDFTVNSGPFPGARGPNEFWGNKAVFNGSTGRLNRAAQLSGITDSKTLTFAFSVNKAASALYTLSDATGATLRVTIDASNQLALLGKNSSGATILSAVVTTAISNATDTSVLICVDLSSASNRAVYLNNVAASVTWTTYTNDSVDLTVADFSLGSEVAGVNYFNGSLGEFYFTTDYINFKQEANRLKFRDAFGNPVDLTPQIAAGTLPNPAIYMRFDPANFGKNSGTGGDFAVSGTITDGGQL